ncbi:MAG TPA: ABC transporter permease, partial [Gammaproteobacteria bacterium]|nr:ABC transporter permease [Gammaproteobacteria bacterium]
MSLFQKLAQAAAVSAIVLATSAQAQISDNMVRIGLLTDMSGPYSSAGGRGTEIAARMALEDWG